MRFGHLERFVENPLLSKDFYTDILGFELVAVQGDQFVWVKLGDTELLLRPGKNPMRSETYQGAANALVLYTDDLNQTAQTLRERGLEFRGTDGSDRCLTFTDPDGNWFQLANPNE
jgi:catechol 2,3-dioxygenase-like lactoylglutathione lyase family enzyme